MNVIQMPIRLQIMAPMIFNIPPGGGDFGNGLCRHRLLRTCGCNPSFKDLRLRLFSAANPFGFLPDKGNLSFFPSS